MHLLRENNTVRGRLVALDGVLFPNWASVFQLFDIRDCDAMYDRKYFPFLRNFIPGKLGNDVDLGDRFTGTGDYDLTTSRALRLLQLSSVRYIASERLFPGRNAIIDDILKQNRELLTGSAGAQINRRDLVLRGDAREGLGEHPPFSRLPYAVQVGNARTFRFSYGLDPQVFDKTATDGVGFMIEIKPPSGAISRAFYSYIDPKHNPAERRWMDGGIDLSRYRGQSIQLLFSTDPGPKGNSSYDWAAWSGFRFDDQPVQTDQSPFQAIYDGEARVYRYDDVLPRASIYYSADLRDGEKDVLRRLADPALDVFQTVVLDRSALNAGELASIAAVNGGPPSRVQPARITSYESQEVFIEASLDRDGILVLNDTGYPGWMAYIDGQRSPWFSANYMFRGVHLGRGKHTVRLVYRPQSFYYGAGVSFATLLALLYLAYGRPINLRRYKRQEIGLSPVPSPQEII